MAVVQVLPIERRQRSVIENLWQLYVHDFSELWAGEDRAELEEDGRWGLTPVAPYFEDPDCTAHLVRVDGHLAGFALVDRKPHSGQPADWSMAEFFVVRKHRRGGVGRSAAHALFAARPGLWEVAVARKNVRALSFWRGAIAGCRAIADPDETDLDDHRWNGAILRFRVGASFPHGSS